MVEPLDCSGLYAFKLNNVLFIAIDIFITEAWTLIPLNRSKILTRTSTGEPIYAYDDWLLVIDFMINILNEHVASVDRIIVFNHYPLAGKNHPGALENDNGFPHVLVFFLLWSSFILI